MGGDMRRSSHLYQCTFFSCASSLSSLTHIFLSLSSLQFEQTNINLNEEAASTTKAAYDDKPGGSSAEGHGVGNNKAPNVKQPPAALVNDGQPKDGVHGTAARSNEAARDGKSGSSFVEGQDDPRAVDGGKVSPNPAVVSSFRWFAGGTGATMGVTHAPRHVLWVMCCVDACAGARASSGRATRRFVWALGGVDLMGRRPLHVHVMCTLCAVSFLPPPRIAPNA